VLDIRKNSSTYGQHFSIELCDDNPILIYIPLGCAHGFLSLTDITMVTYMQSSVYNKESDQGILWNSFAMNWNIEHPIVSDRDKSFVSFGDFKSSF
jgi:dTDP-4-dehydrorhamnose 3,5-epimerase-like enzyme